MAGGIVLVSAVRRVDAVRVINGYEFYNVRVIGLRRIGQAADGGAEKIFNRSEPPSLKRSRRSHHEKALMRHGDPLLDDLPQTPGNHIGGVAGDRKGQIAFASTIRYRNMF